jgi:hypothetical protein
MKRRLDFKRLAFSMLAMLLNSCDLVESCYEHNLKELNPSIGAGIGASLFEHGSATGIKGSPHLSVWNGVEG